MQKTFAKAGSTGMHAFADQIKQTAMETTAKSFDLSITKVALLGNSTASKAVGFAERRRLRTATRRQTVPLALGLLSFRPEKGGHGVQEE